MAGLGAAAGVANVAAPDREAAHCMTRGPRADSLGINAVGLRCSAAPSLDQNLRQAERVEDLTFEQLPAARRTEAVAVAVRPETDLSDRLLPGLDPR